jgi:hypothetical protein
VRQVGYLQRLYRDARSTEHKIVKTLLAATLIPHAWTLRILFVRRSSRRFRIAAKTAYYLRYIRLSVRKYQLGLHWTDLCKI